MYKLGQEIILVLVNYEIYWLLRKNCRAKVFHLFIFSVNTHGLTDLIFQIKKIEIKLYRVLQSVFLLTDFFSNSLSMQTELFYLEKGHCIFYYFDFVTMPGWVHHGNSFFLCVYVQGWGGWGEGEALQAHNKERDSAVCWCT